MITSVAQVITDVIECRCLEASEATRASVSRALASIRAVILPPSQVANRVSKIAPVSSRTISSPLPRAHRPMSGRCVRLKEIAFHDGRTAAVTSNRPWPAPAGAQYLQRLCHDPVAGHIYGQVLEQRAGLLPAAGQVRLDVGERVRR